jgi:nucleoside-diphosphate-sugar epimerase
MAAGGPSLARVLILGCGYTGLRLIEHARQRGLSVLATTRDPGREQQLRDRGATPLVMRELDAATLASYVNADTAIVVTFPPDGHTDARVAELARGAFAAVYVSTTGVYGKTSGPIDDETPVAPDHPRGHLRLQAEACFRAAGATILRVAAIYGPGRGMHVRVRAFTARIAGDGGHHICRIHVDDLCEALLRTVELRLGPDTYVLADDEPCPQGEVVRYLADLLGVPCPPSVPLDAVDVTLRNDRQIDASRFKSRTNLSFRYPSFREGFAACLRAERGELP